MVKLSKNIGSLLCKNVGLGLDLAHPVRNSWLAAALNSKNSGIILYSSFTVPSRISQQRTDHYEKRGKQAGDQVPRGNGLRAFQEVDRKLARRRGRSTVRRRPALLYLDQRGVERGKPFAVHSHAGPLVQARQEHRPNVDGPGQYGQVRGHDHLDGHQERDQRHDDKNQRPINVQRPQRPSGRVSRRKHADPLEGSELQGEVAHRADQRERFNERCADSTNVDISVVVTSKSVCFYFPTLFRTESKLQMYPCNYEIYFGFQSNSLKKKM